MEEQINNEDNSDNEDSGGRSEVYPGLELIEMFQTLVQSKNLNILSKLRLSIIEKDFDNFKWLINSEGNFHKIAQLKPRLINETLLDCLSIARQNNNDPFEPKQVDGCEFIEYLMLKLSHPRNSFLCWDDTCKSIVKVYIHQRRQFTENSITFLLRCYETSLIKQVFDFDLIELNCGGDCSNWHLMFVTSYHERFFTNCFENMFESFMSRYVLLNKLRCLLLNKRSFLTWFAGALHLYADDYFIQNDEARFKLVLSKLFEALVLNGLLNNAEFKSLYHMLIKRNEEISVMASSYNAANESFVTGEIEQESAESSHVSKTISNNAKLKTLSFLPNLDSLFPLSLKNFCRLTIKREMREYTRKCVHSLPLPNNLKKFVYFENECENIFKKCAQMQKAN